MNNLKKKKILEDYEFIKYKIKSRLAEFRSLDNNQKFKELIFCLLTPQSNAKKCWEAVEEISELKEFNENKIKEILKTQTRFHNNKARYVCEAVNKWEEIYGLISNCKNVIELRNLLAENVKGYGLKEAGHFLRNIGLSNNKIAILDRHILRNLARLKIVADEKIKSKKDYFEIEEKFLKFSKEINIPIDELDLVFWSKENGEIFK